MTRSFLGDALEAAARVAPPPIEGLGAVDHLGVKTPDLEAIWPMLRPLGLRCAEVAEHPEVGLRIAFLDGGRVPIELLQVTAESSPVAGDADGLHHVAWRVAGVRAVVERLRSDPRFSFYGPVRRGARGHDIAVFRVTEAPAVAHELVQHC